MDRIISYAIAAAVVIAMGVPMALRVAEQTESRIERALHVIQGSR